MAKRQRQENFTGQECSLLVSEVKAASDLLFAKFSGSIDWEKKNRKWSEITQKINALGAAEGARTTSQVKKKWQDLKKSAKGKEAARRRYLKGTGGGPPPKDLTDIEDKIISILPDLLLEGITGGIDTCMDTATQVATTSISVVEDSDPLLVSVSEAVVEEPSPGPGGDTNDPSISNHVLSTELKRSTGRKRKIEDLSMEERLLKIEEEKLEVQKGILASLQELVMLKKQKLAEASLLLTSPSLSPIIKI